MAFVKFPSVSTRRHVIADPHVQGAILRRVALYALAAVVYYSIVLFFWVFASDREGTTSVRLIQFLDNAITWLPGLFVLGPIAAYDLLSTTNRFAGPVCRLRREMKLLVDNKSPAALSFRDDDHWKELAALFNQLRNELIGLRKESAEPGEYPPSQHQSEAAENLM